MLKWKKKNKCSQTLLKDVAPGSPFWEVKLRWDNLESEPLSMHWCSEVSFGLQLVQTWLSLQVWKSFASSFLHEVDELIRSLCCWLSKHSEAVCVAGTSSKGAPKISISILFSLWRSSASFVMLHAHKAGGYVSRLIYLFYFGLEKLSQLGQKHAFLRRRATSLLASIVWRSTRGKGRLRILNFTLFLCCKIKPNSGL